MIADFLGSIFGFFQNLFSVLFGWLSDLFGWLFEKLFEFLKFLFKPVLILIAIIFLFLYKIGEVVLLLLKVLLGIGKIFFSLIMGIFKTLAGFTFTATARDDGQWTSVFKNVFEGLNYFQIDNVGYVLLFCVWFATGFAAIRIISSMGVGGGE